MNINSLGQAGASAPQATRDTAVRQPGTGVLPAPPAAADPLAASYDAGGASMAKEELKGAVDAINAFLRPISSNIEFSIDEDSGKTIVKLMDKETDTVLRQYPTKEALAIARDIDKFQGLLVKTEA